MKTKSLTSLALFLSSLSLAACSASPSESTAEDEGAQSKSTLDSTFGVGGEARVGYAVAIGFDASGENFYAISSGSLTLARYRLADQRGKEATPDPTFKAAPLPVDVNPKRILVQSTGRVLVFGEEGILAFASDGSLDTTFGESGLIAKTGARSPGSDAASVIQADDKILVAHGTSMNSIGVFRFNADGSPDTGFGQRGGADLRFGDNINRYHSKGLMTGRSDVKGIAVDPTNGGILVVADGDGDKSNHVVGIVRLSASGEIDRSFGNEGLASDDFGGHNLTRANSVFVRKDGRIVVVGETYKGTKLETAIVRFLPSGQLDKSFDGDGRLAYRWNGDSSDWAAAGVPFDDGSFFVVGAHDRTDSPDGLGDRYAAFVRFEDNGGMDNRFDHDGRLTLKEYKDSWAMVAGVALRATADGKVIAAVQQSSRTPIYDLVRFNP